MLAASHKSTWADPRVPSTDDSVQRTNLVHGGGGRAHGGATLFGVGHDCDRRRWGGCLFSSSCSVPWSRANLRRATTRIIQFRFLAFFFSGLFCFQLLEEDWAERALIKHDDRKGNRSANPPRLRLNPVFASPRSSQILSVDLKIAGFFCSSFGSSRGKKRVLVPLRLDEIWRHRYLRSTSQASLA